MEIKSHARNTILTRSHPGSCRGSTAAFAIFAGALSFAITNPHALASPRAPGRVEVNQSLRGTDNGHFSRFGLGFFWRTLFFGASEARRRRLDQIVCAPRELQTAAIVGV
tara:strand:- start:1294 stop:1623 length:330 start_codon:yes stop_codon:yes gene_type:complete